MNSIQQWFYRNGERVSWFIIGFMVCQGLDDLANGRLGGAALAFGLAFINYILSRR